MDECKYNEIGDFCKHPKSESGVCDDKECPLDVEKGDLLKCSKCGIPFVNAIDSISGEVSKYLFKPDCKCCKKDIRIAVG